MRQSARREAGRKALPNTVLKGAYKILAPFRETTNSFLFKGRLLEKPKDLVIKIIKDRYVKKPKFIEQYTEVLEATNHLGEHSNIVKMYDFDYVAQRYCVVTEYFESLSVEELLTKGQTLPLALILKILEQTAKVLGMAHREGLQFRHLKLDNILVCPESHELKITHFDKSRSAFSSVPLRNKVFSVSSDILTLGIMLYRLFCFDYPFAHRNELPELVSDKLEKRLKTTYREVSPDDVQAICSLFIHSTTRDVSRRLGRYEEFIEEIQKLCLSCKPLVEKKEKQEAEEKRNSLETAFDTVAALRGEFNRPKALPISEAERASLAAAQDDSESGALVWGREGDSLISFESPIVTFVLIGLIATLLVGFLYKLFF